MTRKFLLLPALAGMLLACSVFQRGAQPPSDRPADFGIEYQWREGTLPPPYHYEYSIQIAPDGTGQIVMVPDYPSPGVPIWTEPFTVGAGALDDLYALMLEKGVFSRAWPEEDDPPVGGSYDWADVRAGGQSVRLPAFVAAGQARDVNEIFAAIRALVPAEVWDGLNARRQQYIEENE